MKILQWGWNKLCLFNITDYICFFCVLQGYAIDGTTLVVRYPDRIHTRLGVSRDASTESPGKTE